MAMRARAKTQQLTVAQARQGLAAVLHEVERGQTVSVTRRGRPVAVLMSAEKYARLQTGRPSFWETVQSFRRQFDSSAMPGDDALDGLRDRTPGRRSRR
jgi:prevent-host-death family protein